MYWLAQTGYLLQRSGKYLTYIPAVCTGVWIIGGDFIYVLRNKITTGHHCYESDLSSTSIVGRRSDGRSLKTLFSGQIIPEEGHFFEHRAFSWFQSQNLVSSGWHVFLSQVLLKKPWNRTQNGRRRHLGFWWFHGVGHNFKSVRHRKLYFGIDVDWVMFYMLGVARRVKI